MTEQIIRYSTPADREMILDTADRIFTTTVDENGNESYRKGFFEGIQPKLYAPDAPLPPHLLVLEGERLIALAGIAPGVLHMGEQTLKLCGLGTVGVCADCRGKGLMQLLMHRLNEDMERDGVDIAELGGRRLRYARFGYFTGSAGLDLELAAADLSEAEVLPFAFEEMTEATAEELAFFRTLRARNFVYSERSEESFLNVLRTGGRRALRITLNGKTVGYASAKRTWESLTELEIEDMTRLPAALRAYITQYGLGNLSLHNLSPLSPESYRAVAHLASATKLSWGERYRIFNYRRVLEAGLLAKQEQGALTPGRLVIGIGEKTPLALTVAPTGVTVEEANEAPQVTMTEEEATMLLLGARMPLGLLPAGLPAYAAGWFPLPLHVNSNDRI